MWEIAGKAAAASSRLAAYAARMARIELVQGNIVAQYVDAIVNAANASLLGGGGVDGAIHRAAGPALLEECRAIPTDARGQRCPTGEVRVTGAGKLRARVVIHGVGPVYRDAEAETCDRLLGSLHEKALVAAVQHGCSTIAVPAISTGAYRFPVPRAARIAITAVRSYLTRTRADLTVRFVLFSPEDLDVFRKALGADSVEI